MESKQPNYPIKWEVKSHSYQIADTGDYDGYWEITNGKDSLITKEDYDDIEKDLQELADLLNNTYPNFTVDRGNEAALDAENKWLKQELEELREAQPGAVWVKAIDRNPPVNTRLHLKVKGVNHVGFWDAPANCYVTFLDNAYPITDVEWLDEQPAAGREEDARCAVFVPCTEDDIDCCGGYTSNDGRSLCWVKEVLVPLSAFKQQKEKR